MKSALISFSVIVSIIILLYLSPIGYVIPGVFKIYGTGHTTAFLDDYKTVSYTHLTLPTTPYV